MGSVTVRRMEKADLPEVVRIENENFSTPWRADDFAEYMVGDYAIFLVAEENGAIAGYIGAILSRFEGDITNVSVSPERMHEGIGTLLVSELLKRTDERRVDRIFLEVRPSNRHAIRLYEKARFQQVGVRKRYYRLPVEDALVMVRDRECPDEQFTQKG